MASARQMVEAQARNRGFRGENLVVVVAVSYTHLTLPTILLV